MTEANSHSNRPSKLLEFEIERYFGVLAGVTETHRWITPRGLKDIHMPEKATFRFEEELTLVQQSLREGEEVIYSGPISPEQALGEILVRRAALEEQAEIEATRQVA